MDKLLAVLKTHKSIVLGFSGGCDSSLLLYSCAKANIKTLAVTFHSIMYPTSELELAVDTAKKLNIPHRVIHFDPLSIPRLRHNPKERCYICKKSLFTTLTEIAEKEGYDAVVDGSNVDDLKDYRPGFIALQDLGVKSPLVEAGFTKSKIRLLLKEVGLPQWEKPSFACYFSRFPYGAIVDEQSVEQVAQMEEWLHSEGLSSARVRIHSTMARIEASNEHILLCLSNVGLRQRILTTAKELNFYRVCLDVEGYRTGSMNEPFSFSQISPIVSTDDRVAFLTNTIKTEARVSVNIFPHDFVARMVSDIETISFIIKNNIIRQRIIELSKKVGFIYIAFDLEFSDNLSF